MISHPAAESLNGLWDFAFLGAVDLRAFVPAMVGTWEKMPVPSAFDAMPSHAGKRGAACYRRLLAIPPGRAAKVQFEAVSMWCRVYVDGSCCGEHACGYSPFEVVVPPSETAGRELVVLVDNRFDFERVPMHEEYFDFHQYVGILRDVTLRRLPATGPFLDAVLVRPEPEYRSGAVEAQIALCGADEAVLLIRFDGHDPIRRDVRVDNGSVRLPLQVPAPRVWSPENPHRHNLEVILVGTDGRELDRMVVRFGLRRIEAREGALWLNGEKLVLKGVNRHEWHPNFGPCTPDLQMAADLQLLRRIGVNFIRGSHYPQSQRFLDLCDELGFLVWEENLGWGQRERTFASDKFRRDHLASLQAMVKASFNHPSVIIWGFLNEAGSNEAYVRPIFEETVATLRALDSSRLISFASMFGKTDQCFDLVDLISLNIYPGWYDCEGVENPLDLIEPAMRDFFAAVDARGFRDKPVMISEIGAEGLYGWRDAHDGFFTEAYQAEYLRRACRTALEHPRSSGIAIWHFSDVRTYGGGLSLKRPRAFNNKGIFDEYRRPKDAAAAVGEVFGGETPIRAA